MNNINLKKIQIYKLKIEQIKAIIQLKTTEEIDDYMIEMYGEESGEALIDVLNNDAEKQIALIEVVVGEYEDFEKYEKIVDNNRQINKLNGTDPDKAKALEEENQKLVKNLTGAKQ